MKPRTLRLAQYLAKTDVKLKQSGGNKKKNKIAPKIAPLAEQT